MLKSSPSLSFSLDCDWFQHEAFFFSLFPCSQQILSSFFFFLSVCWKWPVESTLAPAADILLVLIRLPSPLVSTMPLNKEFISPCYKPRVSLWVLNHPCLTSVPFVFHLWGCKMTALRACGQCVLIPGKKTGKAARRGRALLVKCCFSSRKPAYISSLKFACCLRDFRWRLIGWAGQMATLNNTGLGLEGTGEQLLGRLLVTSSFHYFLLAMPSVC